MSDQNDKNLNDRVEQLEKRVEELQHLLKQLDEPLIPKEQNLPEEVAKESLQSETHSREHVQPPVSPKPKPPIAPSQKPLPSRKTFQIPENMQTSEFWLNKIGIGLLLFGVVFLFKYSIDQGWITPVIRVTFGLALAIALLVVGLRIYSKRPHFSQVLLGGAIAAFYICGFSAFQLYTLISHPVAFVFMVSVTTLAFVLSLKQNEAILSLIGAIGGFGTPFLLYTESGSLPGLVGYTCLILAGTGAIYFYRGWRSLLWVSFLGGWIVFWIALSNGLPNEIHGLFGDHGSLQSGIVFAWLTFWAMPVIRKIAKANNPNRWPLPSSELSEEISEKTDKSMDRQIHILSVSTPLISLLLSMQIWSISDESWGWITMGMAFIYGLVYLKLKRLDSFTNIAQTHSLTGILLITIAFCLILDGDLLLFILAIEATVLTVIAHRFSDTILIKASHILFVIVGLWLWGRLNQTSTPATVVFNSRALTDLWVICVSFGVTLLFKTSLEKNLYRFIAHVALLGWFARELHSLPNGQGYVTIAWGIYALTLLIIGLRLNQGQLRNVAVGTLVLVVGKLFIVDLAQLKAIWRILLFLGFGGVFLIISYYFQTLWKGDSKASENSTTSM